MVELDPKELERQSIMAEIQSWKDSGQAAGWHSKLNNFILILPTLDFPDGNFHFCANEDLDTPYCELVSKENSPIHSQLFMVRTPRQLLEAVDTAIAISGVSREKILDLRHKKFENGQEERTTKDIDRRNILREESIKLYNELYELALPVYLELRLMGYNHLDLV